MLDRNDAQKQIFKWTGGALIVALLLLFSLLIWRASGFVGNNVEQMVSLNVGPIKLIELGRQKIDGQTAAVIIYHSGLIFYFAFFLVSGALLGLSQSQKH